MAIVFTFFNEASCKIYLISIFKIIYVVMAVGHDIVVLASLF